MFAKASACLLSSTLVLAQAPQVVSLVPDHGSCEVDAATTKQLVLTFDRPMAGGRSLCGGGPKYPKITKVDWKDTKTLVVAVELEPDHDYELGINCASFRNFQSTKGVPLEPRAWSFSTLPLPLPDQSVQKARNQKALDELLALLAAKYSHYDLRIQDWPKLVAQHRAAILAAKTDKGWTAAVARMLTPTEDLHLHLRCGERVFPTGTRAVDPLFRLPLLQKVIPTRSVCDQVLLGRTDDGIGYLLVAGLGKGLDPDAVQKAVSELQGIRSWIVDLRPNSGGDEGLAQRVAALFVAGEHVYAKHRTRTGPGKNGFGPVLERSLRGTADESGVGKLVVLTSRYVMSSAESLVLMLTCAKECTTLGQPTYGSSGNPKPFTLTNGVTVVIPTWQDLRRDGSCFEGQGLAPDVLVPCTAKDLEARDPLLEKALELLRRH